VSTPASPFIESTADFERLVRLGETTESLTLDFKRDIGGFKAAKHDAKREGQKELARDIAQFANTSGGCLLIGIGEAQVNGKKVAGTVHAIDDFDGRRQWIEQAVQNFLVPTTVAVHPVAIDVAGGTIIAVNVPASEHLVWLWDREAHTMESLRRTSHGKEWLNPDETERHLMNSSRAAKLAFERVMLKVDTQKEVELASGVWTWRRAVKHAPYTKERARCRTYLNGRDDHALQLCIRFDDPSRAPVVVIPYGLVHDVWATVDGRLGLLLDVRLALDPDGGIVMEPF